MEYISPFLKFLEKFLIRNIITINQDFDKNKKEIWYPCPTLTLLTCGRVDSKISNFFHLLSTTFEINVCYHLLIDSRYVFVYRSQASIQFFFVSYMHAFGYKNISSSIPLLSYGHPSCETDKQSTQRPNSILPTDYTQTHIQENQLSLVLK